MNENYETYKVDEGETLVGIALKLNISINNLKRLNNINSNNVFPGQVRQEFTYLLFFLYYFDYYFVVIVI